MTANTSIKDTKSRIVAKSGMIAAAEIALNYLSSYLFIPFGEWLMPIGNVKQFGKGGAIGVILGNAISYAVVPPTTAFRLGFALTDIPATAAASYLCYKMKRLGSAVYFTFVIKSAASAVTLGYIYNLTPDFGSAFVISSLIYGAAASLPQYFLTRLLKRKLKNYESYK